MKRVKHWRARVLKICCHYICKKTTPSFCSSHSQSVKKRLKQGSRYPTPDKGEGRIIASQASISALPLGTFTTSSRPLSWLPARPAHVNSTHTSHPDQMKPSLAPRRASPLGSPQSPTAELEASACGLLPSKRNTEIKAHDPSASCRGIGRKPECRCKECNQTLLLVDALCQRRTGEHERDTATLVA